jgi:hypothetical protein
MITTAPSAMEGLIDDQSPPIRFRYVTAAAFLAERLAALATADASDHATFDALHDRVVAAMADDREARTQA